MEWANIALTIVLSMIALAGILVKGVGWAVEHALVKKGLVRPTSDGSNWPNGWHNLPDALQGIHDAMKEIQSLHSQERGI